MPVGRGIKKVNENVLTNGRGILVTEQDKNQYQWSDIPVGSKLIDTIDGKEYVKLEGETDWVPAHVKNDNTLSIAKDSIVKKEVFTIVNPDEGDGNFSYTNTLGQIRHMPKTEDGYLFELEDGTYAQFRNHLEVTIDDVLTRDTVSGGLIEVNYHRFIVTDTELIAGQEITARYLKVIRIGNPYPRFFFHKDTPEDAEIGDFWLDTDATLAEVDYLGEGRGELEVSKRLPWSRIDNKPTTLQEYGVRQEVQDMIEAYKVPYSMIKDAPKWPSHVAAHTLIDNNGVEHYPGIGAGNVLIIGSDGRIPLSVLPPSLTSLANSMPDIRIGPSTPTNPTNNKTIWFCTASGSRCVYVYSGGWIPMGAIWN